MSVRLGMAWSGAFLGRATAAASATAMRANWTSIAVWSEKSTRPYAHHMPPPDQGWDAFSPEQRETIERQLRARGIDPASIKSVRVENPEAAPAGPVAAWPPPTPTTPASGSGEEMVDLARPASPRAGQGGEATPIIHTTHRIEFTINGQKRVFSSWDEVPEDLRVLLSAAHRATMPGSGAGDASGRFEGAGVASVGFEAGRPTKLAPEDIQQLEHMLRSGQKIDAVKLVRERTNLGLAESKTIVDAMETALGLSSKRGCAGMVLLGVGLGVMLWALL